jgi:hypothetical protein
VRRHLITAVLSAAAVTIACLPGAAPANARTATAGTTTATVAAGSITVLAPTTGTRGVAYRVSGVLSADGVPVAAAKVALKRTDLAGARTLIVTTSVTGGFSYRDIPTVGGPVTWLASWGGDATSSSASASAMITIARASTSLSIKASAMRYAYGAKATVTVHLGATYNRRDVFVYARPLGTSVTAPGTLLVHARVNSAGNAVVTYVMRRNTTFTVAFRGDYRYAPATRAVTARVVPRVTVTLSGWSAFTGGFYVFTNARPHVHVVVTPSIPGACIGIQVGFYAGNTWQHGNVNPCLYLDANSTVDSGVPDGITGTTHYFVIANVLSTPSTAAGASSPLYFRFA